MTEIETTPTAVVEADQNGDRPTPSAGAAIVFDEVTKVYEPGVTALSDVSFVIEKGEFVFVVGASGSGKSTMIRLVLKELEPTSGRIIVGGRDLSRLRRGKVPQLRRNVGCVFQDFKLLPNRTASENVAYALKVQGESQSAIRRKVPEVLSLVGLAHKMNSYPDELSGGEQQRVSIARAFVNHPPLLICDEPTGNLDPDTSIGIMQLLYRINRSGTTILMVTHDREMVDKMRRRVLALEDGRLVARRAARRVRGRVRFQLLFAEALRSARASLSTTFAATMTVLIGMFLLGVCDRDRHVGELVDRQPQAGARRRRLLLHRHDLRPRSAREEQINAVRERLESDPRVEEVNVHLEGGGARDHEEARSGPRRRTSASTRCPTPKR